jgi:type IV secretion system protein VirB6
MFTPQGMLWLSGLMLLVGTVGVLVTAKVALAALLALGPVFIVLALFAGTRGLFEGWLKAVVSFAMVPMFTVLIGGATLGLIAPLIRDALIDSTQIATRSVTALFLAACVYSALMAIVVKTTTTIVSGWRLPFAASREPGGVTASVASPASQVAPMLASRPTAALAGDRVRAMMASLPAPSGGAPDAIDAMSHTRRIVSEVPASASSAVSKGGDRRLHGVGSRFRAPPATPSRVRLS